MLQPEPNNNLININKISEDGLKEYLRIQGWPNGMTTLTLKSIKSTPFRYYVIDDSGSMSTHDSYRLLIEGNKSR